MRVAFASSDGKHINCHFAQAHQFIVFDVEPERVRKIGGLFLTPGREHEDRVQKRVEVLKGCDIVYCTQIGGPAAAHLVQNNIHPLKVENGSVIEESVAVLQGVLNKNPAPWILKKFKKPTIYQ